MTDPLKLAVAALAQHRNQSVMKPEECKLTWCFDLRWFEPSQADKVLQAAIGAGYLEERVEGLKVTFTVDELVIPTGFQPNLDELLTPLPIPARPPPPDPSPTTRAASTSSTSSNSTSISSSTAITTPLDSSSTPAATSSSQPRPSSSQPKTSRSDQRSRTVTQNRSAKTDEPLFPVLIKVLQESTSLPRRDIISRINRSQKEHGLTDIEVEGLLEGARLGVTMDRYYEPISRLLKDRYDRT